MTERLAQKTPVPAAETIVSSTPPFVPGAQIPLLQAGNLAVQRLLLSGGSSSPDEVEADRLAQQLPSSAPGGCACHGHDACPKCAAARQHGVRPKERPGPTRQVRPEIVASAVAPLTAGHPLPGSQREFFEPRFGAQFDHVRVHIGPEAEIAAARLNARAFTLGSDIVFGHGEYRPESDAGRQLLAHELTHVIQQSGAPPQAQRTVTNQTITPAYAASLSDRTLEAEVSTARQALQDPATGPVDRMALQENLGILEAEVSSRNLRAPAGPSQDLESRLAAFKQLVLTTARLRLAANRSNLAIWRTVVAGLPLSRESAQTIQVAQLQQTVGHMAVGQWDLDRCLAERNPIRRQIYCGQLEGRYRACAGCHMEQLATRLDSEAGSTGRAMWSSMAAQVTGIPDPVRPSLSLAAPDDWQAFAQPAPSAAQSARIDELTATYRMIIGALGPDGYQVWPDSFVNWDSADLEAIRSGILSRIEQRQSDYLELMGMIASGERDYLEFEPILQDLLPLADADVRQAVADEIEARRHRGVIKTILVGLATIGALLLTIFPPTSALGVAALSALEVGLGAYAVASGVEMFDQGYAASLSTGTDNVYSREQQNAAGTQMFFGFINIVTGPLMAYTGVIRGVGAAGRIATAGASSALTPSSALTLGRSTVFGGGELTSLGAGTVRQGRLLLSYDSSGTIVGTVEGRPDLLMIARDGEAVLYQRAADGGLTAVQRSPLSLLNPAEAALDPAVAANREAWAALTTGHPTAGRLFEVGQDLNGIEELTIIDHGSAANAADMAAISTGERGADLVNLTGVGKVNPEQLADILAQAGWRGGHLRLIACSTGLCTGLPASFGEQLSISLNAMGLPTVVAAPRGLAAIGSELFGTAGPFVVSPRIGIGVGAFNYY